MKTNELNAENVETIKGDKVQIAFMPLDNYLSGFSIIISSRVVTEDVNTSILITELNVTTKDTDKHHQEITRSIPNLSGDALRNIEQDGIICIGTNVKPGDILVGKVTLSFNTELTKTDELYRRCFDGDWKVTVKDSSQRVPSHCHGIVQDVKVSHGRDISKRLTNVEPTKIENMLKKIKNEHKKMKDKLTDDLTERLSDILLGEIILLDVVNSQDGEIIIRANRKITKTLLRKLASLHEHIQIDPSPIRDKILGIVDSFNSPFQELEIANKRLLDRLFDFVSNSFDTVDVFISTKYHIERSDGCKIPVEEGNKVVKITGTMIVSESEMPTRADGTPIDILLNPLGVKYATNKLQTLESHLRVSAKSLGLDVTNPVFSPIEERLIDPLTKTPFKNCAEVGSAEMCVIETSLKDALKPVIPLDSLAASIPSTQEPRPKPDDVEMVKEFAITLEEAYESYDLDLLPMGYSIRRYFGNEVAVTLPAMIGNRPVKRIGNSAFINSDTTRNISISRYVTEICNEAFSGCSSLEKVLIPESVKEIGSEAFRDCAKITKVVLPDSLRSIGEKAFAGCTALAEVNLPSGITECGGHLFEGCDELRSLVIPGTFKKIGNALAGCKGLEELALPASVTEIGAHAFEGCVSLKSLIIPASVTQIGQSAFRGCTSLLHVEVPASLESIARSAFLDSKVLESVAVRFADGDSTWRGWRSFSNCPSVASLHVEGDLREIEASFILGFTGRSIWKQVFVQGSVSRIGNTAFVFYDSLQRITFSNLVAEISPVAFLGCDKLETIQFESGSSFAFAEGMLYENEKRTLVLCLPSASGSQSIPSGVEEIRSKAFAACYQLESVSIPSSVRKIAEDAFEGFDTIRSEEQNGIVSIALKKKLSPSEKIHSEDEAPVGLADLIAQNLDD